MKELFTTKERIISELGYRRRTFADLQRLAETTKNMRLQIEILFNAEVITKKNYTEVLEDLIDWFEEQMKSNVENIQQCFLSTIK